MLLLHLLKHLAHFVLQPGSLLCRQVLAVCPALSRLLRLLVFVRFYLAFPDPTLVPRAGTLLRFLLLRSAASREEKLEGMTNLQVVEDKCGFAQKT